VSETRNVSGRVWLGLLKRARIVESVEKARLHPNILVVVQSALLFTIEVLFLVQEILVRRCS